MAEFKDPLLNFLETVTYDEVMGYTYVLNTGARAELQYNSIAAKLKANALEIASTHYGWDKNRMQYLGKLCNWHLLGIPTRDWRMNYFLSLGQGYPEETLEEQFEELKAQGDTYKQLVVNALKYRNRMIELRMAIDAITSLYPMVHLEDDTLSLPAVNGEFITVAWADTSNRTVHEIQRLVSTYFTQSLIFCLTADVEEKRIRGACGTPSLLAGKMYAEHQHTQLVGENGIIRLDRNSPASLSIVR